MKHIAFVLLALLLLPALSLGQTITMEQAHLTFDYPDSWLVVSPQLARVYAPLLEDQGIDAQLLSEEMGRQGVHSRAYSEDFSQTLSVITMQDDTSMEIFNMSEVTDSQRRTLKNRAQNGAFFEVTGLRVQDSEWQKEKGIYWLYIHYTKTYADETIGRGLRYMTILNGQYVMLDWQLSGRRFSNRDLNSFRDMLHDLNVTAQVEQPVRSVTLTASIPAETSSAQIEITGKTSPGAGLAALTPDGEGGMRTLSVGQAGSSGTFKLLVELEEEGTQEITLIASLEGRQDASVSGTVSYSEKTLPVSIEGIAEDSETIVTTDKVEIKGKTLAGVQFQLVTPYGLTKKRAGNDGSFSFELTTEDEGTYKYTLIGDKSGFDQRRIQFTLVRQRTNEQEQERIKENADKLSYKKLQSNLDENMGKVLVIYGPVVSVSEGGGAHYVRLYYNKDANGTWYNPVVIVGSEDMGVKVGDMMSVVAKVSGVFEEQDASGREIMVPRLELMFVDKIE